MHCNVKKARVTNKEQETRLLENHKAFFRYDEDNCQFRLNTEQFRVFQLGEANAFTKSSMSEGIFYNDNLEFEMDVYKIKSKDLETQQLLLSSMIPSLPSEEK